MRVEMRRNVKTTCYLESRPGVVHGCVFTGWITVVESC